jgi:hypothetical protein
VVLDEVPTPVTPMLRGAETGLQPVRRAVDELPLGVDDVRHEQRLPRRELRPVAGTRLERQGHRGVAPRQQ